MPNNITYDKSTIREIGQADPAFQELEDSLTQKELELRQDALRILMGNFGTSGPTASIYECANEWCQKQATTSGLVSYYKAYYNGKHDNT
tara:strand:+ start:325 stop:594 length:270 start_codon:yes stop_codon:yes gene_type:complete